MEDLLGFEKLGEEGEYIRFKSSADIGNIIDIKTTSRGRGITSLGIVHHIAWRVEDEEDLSYVSFFILPLRGYILYNIGTK